MNTAKSKAFASSLLGLALFADIGPAQSPPADPAITYIQGSGSTYSIKVMNSDGTNQRTVYGPVQSSTAPRMSPDGSQVAFAATIGTQRGIFVVNSNGTGLRKVTSLTNPSTLTTYLSWSPVPTLDGHAKILFVDLDKAPFPVTLPLPTQELYTVNLDGSNRQRLTFDGVKKWHADWSHDSTRVVFQPHTGNSNVMKVAQLGLVAGLLAVTSVSEITNLPGSPLQAATTLVLPAFANTADVVLVSAIVPGYGNYQNIWMVPLLNPTLAVPLTSSTTASSGRGTFTGDDSAIVFERSGSGIMLMNSNGGSQVVLNTLGRSPNHRRT